MTDTSLIATVKRGIDRAGRDWREHNGFADVPDGVLAKAAIAAVRRWEAENGWRCVPVKATLGQALGTPSMKREEDMDRICADYAAQVAASPPPPGSVKEPRE
ncbi:hypothetical protein TSA6c_00415 [Azospirillum sp. TSA6c]|uniref:hypothetical protein n=1 Tax=Azospirillum sp. TSA6c TaxID=709813 RepID=UPI000D614040|nr:hypothetical protein [Azospirillum sp. TSA6c]PWC54365.1 hypothetical protein TSA6c_00415 [Azospirillum sp. TSA6c]